MAEADDPSEVGPADTCSLGKGGKGKPVACDKRDVEAACPEEQLDQARIWFCRGKGVGTVDQHSDLPPSPASPHWHGQDQTFVVTGARQRGSTSNIAPSRNGRMWMSVRSLPASTRSIRAVRIARWRFTDNSRRRKAILLSLLTLGLYWGVLVKISTLPLRW